MNHRGGLSKKERSLREVLAHIYTCLMRNKVLKPMKGWSVAAVDGHEIGCSYKRCCDECLTRHTTVNDEQRLQYHHRIVAFQGVPLRLSG